MHHTYTSLTHNFFGLFYVFIFSLSSKTSCTSPLYPFLQYMILSSFLVLSCSVLLFNNRSETPSPREPPEALVKVQNGMLWLDHAFSPLSSFLMVGAGQPRGRSGDDTSSAVLPWLTLQLTKPLRDASSCAGPGGRTWRNTCRETRERDKLIRESTGQKQTIAHLLHTNLETMMIVSLKS